MVGRDSCWFGSVRSALAADRGLRGVVGAVGMLLVGDCDKGCLRVSLEPTFAATIRLWRGLFRQVRADGRARMRKQADAGQQEEATARRMESELLSARETLARGSLRR